MRGVRTMFIREYATVDKTPEGCIDISGTVHNIIAGFLAVRYQSYRHIYLDEPIKAIDKFNFRSKDMSTIIKDTYNVEGNHDVYDMIAKRGIYM